MHPASRLLTTTVFCICMAMPLDAGPAPCKARLVFEHPDEGGTRRAQVYEQTSPKGAAPLFFIDTLKTNTDGTVTSYHQDDPLGTRVALNDIAYAMASRRRSLFIRLRDNDWEPVATAQAALGNVIEFDRRSGKPCITPEGYLVSMTLVPAYAGARKRKGDCDPSKWLDGLSVPAIVLPLPREGWPGTGFDFKRAGPRSLVVGMTVEPPYRVAYGIVGDKGPPKQLGEATIAFNRALNGMPPEAAPSNYTDVKRRFQGARSIIMIFPGEANRIRFPITARRIHAAVGPVFERWGGVQRLKTCLGAIRG